jgi:hypothetical protein
MGIGHGQGNVFSGAGRLPVYQVGQYADAEVNGRVIHWTACDTAQVLGPDMVARGARAFFGYIEDIIFPPQLAQIIFDCDAEIDRALVQGSTTAQAQQRAIGRFNSYIDALRRRNPSDFLIPWVELNRDRLRGPLNGSIFGDGETRIT